MRKEVIGACELYLGDCREVLPTLNNVDAVLTDPPYLDGDFSDVLPLLLERAPRVVVTPGKLCAFDWIAREKPTWEYAWRGSQNTRGGRACMAVGFEPVLSYGWPLVPLGTDVLTYPIVNDDTQAKTGHPWPKPRALIKKLLAHWSRSGHTVMDPFLGSGTTGIAAVESGRRFIGVEIEPKYFDIACKRIEEATRQLDLFVEQPAKQLKFAETSV